MDMRFAGVFCVVVGEAETLVAVVEAVAQVVGHPLGDKLTVEEAHVFQKAPHHIGRDDDDAQDHYELPVGIAQQTQLVDGGAQQLRYDQLGGRPAQQCQICQTYPSTIVEGHAGQSEDDCHLSSGAPVEAAM